MRSRLVTLFSVLMIGLGMISIIWVSSALVGAARSQTPPAPSAAPPAPAAAAPPTTTVPAVAPPPPSSTPSPPEAEAFVPPQIFQNPEGYTYDPTGRRDPFRPFGQSQIVAPKPVAQSAEVVVKEPLQMYDIAQLKVIGIVWEVRDPKAMIRDPGGKLHMIRKETKIGRNNGFVAAIREGEVIVVEPTVNEEGAQTALTRVMVLNR